MKKDNTQAYEELNKLKIEVAKMLDPNYNYDYYNKKRGNKKWKKIKENAKWPPNNYKACYIWENAVMFKRMARLTIEKENTRERIMIKMAQLLGILTGGIIALFMGIWVAKKL